LFDPLLAQTYNRTVLAALSLPVGGHVISPDGRGTGGHSYGVIIERMQGHWLGRSRSCTYGRMIS